MANTIMITIAMTSAALLAFVAIPLQAIAQVSAGGTVGIGDELTTKQPGLPKISEPEVPAIPELPDIAESDISATTELEFPTIPTIQ
jgi:hypothetical protein